MPEISDLITADSELESTKLEYEQLLIQEKNLVKEITKAKNDNCKIYFINILGIYYLN